MKNPQKVKCPVCKVVRLVDYRNFHKIQKKEITTRCFKCSRFKKGQTNDGGYKKGAVPWNKGKKGVMPTPWNKGLKGCGFKEKNGMWKGESASYFAKHLWIINNHGNPKKCEHCKKVGEKIKGRWNVHWANISGEFKRDIKDWIALCAKCHSKYDNERRK